MSLFFQHNQPPVVSDDVNITAAFNLREPVVGNMYRTQINITVTFDEVPSSVVEFTFTYTNSDGVGGGTSSFNYSPSLGLSSTFNFIEVREGTNAYTTTFNFSNTGGYSLSPESLSVAVPAFS